MKISPALLPVLALAMLASSSCIIAPVPGAYAGPWVPPVGCAVYDTLPVGFYGDYYLYGGRYYHGGRYESGRWYHNGQWHDHRYSHNGHYYYGGHAGHAERGGHR